MKVYDVTEPYVYYTHSEDAIRVVRVAAVTLPILCKGADLGA